MIHMTQILSDFVSDLRFEDIPEEAIRQIRLFIADYYAAAIAGFRINRPFNTAVFDVLSGMKTAPEASVLLSDTKMCVENAAFMNAVYCHGAELDDGNRKAMGHVEAHVMSAVFAMAETLPVKWEDVLTAIAAGYEVFDRLGAAVQPSHMKRGYHSTGTVGTIACAASCARLMGLNRAETYGAISLAAVQSSGLFVIMESGQGCKPINPANAARIGILSAKLAAKGIECPRYPLESDKGWFHALADGAAPEEITAGLGKRFTILDCYLKPYSCCRHTHCAIDAAIQVRRDITAACGEAFSPDVRKIRLSIYRNAIAGVGSIRIPKTLDDAKFSLTYITAIALLKGRFHLSDLPVSNLTDEVVALIDRMELVEDDSLDNPAENMRGARISVEMTDGRSFDAFVKIPKGEAENRFDWEDIGEKFANCAEGVLTAAEQRAFLQRVRDIDPENAYRVLTRGERCESRAAEETAAMA